jgi:fructose-1,6-bisphosphatase/inositol monophosphatase family enzyme
MNYTCENLSLGDVENGRLGAPKEWAIALRPLIAAGLVDESNVTRWGPVGELFSGMYAKQLRGDRGPGPFPVVVWSTCRGEFGLGNDSDVSRLQKQGCFSPLDLADFQRLRPERIRVEDYISWVRKLFVTKDRQDWKPDGKVSTGTIVNGLGVALRAAANVADRGWDAIWDGTGAAEPRRNTVDDIGREIRNAIEEGLPESDLYWITEHDVTLPEREGLVFFVEPLGGERNFRRRIPLYTISVAAAWVTKSSCGLNFAPICAGVYVPCAQHLYLGVPGNGGGAALVDERRNTVHRLIGSSNEIGGERLTVGIHHSRNEVLLSAQFVSLVSSLLPATVDKELAIGAGAWSLAMTASGSLAAYFEASMSYAAAYAGAILLWAATGRKEAATDLSGGNWVEGDPTLKRGILAWGHEGLQKDIRPVVESGSKILSAIRS